MSSQVIKTNIGLPNLKPPVDLITGEQIKPEEIPTLEILVEKVEDENGNIFGVVDYPYLIYIEPTRKSPKITIGDIELTFGGYINTETYDNFPKTNTYILSNACQYEPLDLFKQANLGKVDLINYPNLIWLHEEWTKRENIATIENVQTYFELNTFSKFGHLEVYDFYNVGDLKASFAPPEILLEDGWLPVKDGQVIEKSKYPDLYNLLASRQTGFTVTPESITMVNTKWFISMAGNDNEIGKYFSFQWKGHSHSSVNLNHEHSSNLSNHGGNGIMTTTGKSIDHGGSHDRKYNGGGGYNTDTAILNANTNVSNMNVNSTVYGTGSSYQCKGFSLPFYIYTKKNK